jgi:hypothetical protein
MDQLIVLDKINGQYSLCLSRTMATSPNSALNLLRLPHEGVPGKLEAQLWLSTFGRPQARLDAFRARWQQRLQDIFAA